MARAGARGPILFWAATVAGLIVATAALPRQAQLPLALRLGLALLPAVATVMYGRSVLRCIRSGDELQARIQVEAGMIGLFGLILLIQIVGMLSMVHIIPPITVEQAWPWVWISGALFWAFGIRAGWRRYR